MEGLNLKGSPQAIDSVDAVQIDSMVSSLRSLLDPLPNSSSDNYYSPPSWSSSCRSSDSIFDNPCTNQSWDNLIPLQLLLRLLFNLEISNRGESKRISSSSEISPEIEDKSSMEEISFKIFHSSSMEWNFSSFRGLRSFRLRKGNRLKENFSGTFFRRENSWFEFSPEIKMMAGTNLRQNNGQKHTEPLASDVRGLI